MESAEKVLISPWSLNLGGILKLGDTPKPPPGSFLDLFFGKLL